MNRLRVLRAERRFSQWTAATCVGMTENRYWRIENGRIAPTPDEMARLATAFGVSEKELGFASSEEVA